MKVLIGLLFLMLVAGCSPKVNNPDIRPLLDGLNTESTYNETLQNMKGQFSVTGKIYRSERAYPITPDERFGFYWSPSASGRNTFLSVIRLHAKGRIWSYYANIYFDPNGRILGVNYEALSSVFPPSEPLLKWSPKW